jgi:hypothetical protein
MVVAVVMTEVDGVGVAVLQKALENPNLKGKCRGTSSCICVCMQVFNVSEVYMYVRVYL